MATEETLTDPFEEEEEDGEEEAGSDDDDYVKGEAAFDGEVLVN